MNRAFGTWNMSSDATRNPGQFSGDSGTCHTGSWKLNLVTQCVNGHHTGILAYMVQVKIPYWLTVIVTSVGQALLPFSTMTQLIRMSQHHVYDSCMYMLCTAMVWSLKCWRNDWKVDDPHWRNFVVYEFMHGACGSISNAHHANSLMCPSHRKSSEQYTSMFHCSYI